VEAVQVSPAEYDALLTRAYKAANLAKPRSAVGVTKDLPPREMETLLLANTVVSEEDLRLLAERRAETVRTSLIDGEHIPQERCF
jgi:hypothetical protein